MRWTARGGLMLLVVWWCGCVGARADALVVVPQARLERARTGDGLQLALRRYPSSGPPVILMHGLAQNGRIWDLSLEGHSLARHLARRGWDVWVANFRGHGKGVYRSQPGPGWRWTVDDFVTADIPAIVAHVRARTGRRPFWVGHSMGGMTAMGYLQGARRTRVVVDRRRVWRRRGLRVGRETVDVHATRVTVDAALAERRQRELAGVVTLGSPALIAWPAGAGGWDDNPAVRALARIPGLRSSWRGGGRLPLGRLIDGGLGGGAARLPLVGPLLSRGLRRVAGQLGTTSVASQGWAPDNVTPTLVEAIVTQTMDDVSACVASQFLDWAEHRTFREFHTRDRARRPHVYAAHYHRVRLPALVIAGDRDRLACDDVVRAAGFARLGGTDRSFAMIGGFGHEDLVNGLRAEAQVYPRIEAWMRARIPAGE